MLLQIRSRASISFVFGLLTSLCGCGLSSSVPAVKTLGQAFQHPPASARPWVYWFWLSGNITKEGITADLEAMKRAGIGGVLIMEVDQGAPVGPVDFAGPKWRELFKHVVAECDRLGLEVNMNNDAGWNGSGGPWIKPEQSMQKVVWTDTAVEGGKRFEGTLPQPAATAYYYRDIRVLAFPATGDFRIGNIAVKACFQVGNAGPIGEQKTPASMVIDRKQIVDLTDRMDAQGRLSWDAPEGKWTVVRFGHTSTGMVNAPAPLTGRGLECDKLSKEGIDANFAGLMGKLIEDVGGRAGKTLVTTHIDSWENGAQNWTLRMREEFQKRRGYDLLPFLPVIAGRVVDSVEVSERFLWDLRQTVSDLVVENYAGRLAELAHQHNMKLSIEAYGGPTDDLPYGGRADEPMSEFWIGAFMYENSKEMASVAHTYGRRILGAESFTATDAEKWQEHPGSIKALGDQAFCAGVNRFVFHRYAMQPWLDRTPGMTMGPWGLHYERTNTWWKDSSAWHLYLARCQHLLRQGLFVADLCYLQPEEAPQGLHGHAHGAYDFDNCSAEAVLTRMSVKDGRIVLPDGMSYRALVLPSTGRMTPKLLTRIAELAREGATVIGMPPTKSPSLSGYPECDRQVAQIATAMWGGLNPPRGQSRPIGSGHIISDTDAERVLAQQGVPPDFSNRSRLNYIHRSVDGAEIYFVANPEPIPVQAPCRFRISGKRAELWWPETGRIEPATFCRQTGGITEMLLTLEASGSVFVVFRDGPAPVNPVIEIKRDGKVILATRVIGPEIQIEKAVYGVLDDPQRTRDVVAKVQQNVNRGEYIFRVSTMAEGDDPAVNIVKTLRVEYVIEGRRVVVSGQDPDLVQLTADSHRIVVKKARYGILNDPKRTRDLTRKLQELIDGGLREFKVAQMAAGDDPAFGIVKTLELEYMLDDTACKVSATDSDQIRLTRPRAADRFAQIRSEKDGVVLEAWKPGAYEIARDKGPIAKLTIAPLPKPIPITGPWTVRLDSSPGAPAQITMTELDSLSRQSAPEAKYFSGEATYHVTFNVSQDVLAVNRRWHLDLGRVEVMAQALLNGHDLGLCWKAPYRTDVSDLLKAGVNELQVRVVTQWINRMIGDEQLPEDSDRNPDGTLKKWPQWLLDGKPSPTGRRTFTTWRLWKKDSPLRDSGLIGPVELIPTTISSLP